MSEMNWMNREKVLHEKFFDTLSRPLSRASKSSRPNSNGRETPSNMFSGGLKVKWDHFGKKHQLKFSGYELEYADLYDVLLKKVHEQRHDFEGELAFIDQYGRQVTLTSDKDVREALQQSKNKLKLHTLLRNGAVIAAAEMADAARQGRPARSQSVPPERSYQTYPQRSPSSMESAPDALYRSRAMSPPPMSTTMTHSPPIRQTGEIVKTTVSHRGSYSAAGASGYGYPGHPVGPYSQSILYGMPPHNGMLWRFLANPFPFGGTQSRTFIGPNKYHHFGGYNHMYSSGGWGGPVW